MAKPAKRLVNSQLANAKPKEKTYRLYDGLGLCLRVSPAGAKVWEYRYINPENKKENTYVIGDYEMISLAEARRIHFEKRQLVFDGINPNSREEDLSFEIIYKKWFETVYMRKVSEKQYTQQNRLLYNYCMKHLAHLDITEITAKNIYKALQEIEKSGSLSQIKRAKSTLSQVFDFAIQLEIIHNNPTLRIKSDIFEQHESKGHRSLQLNEIYKMHAVFANSDVDLTIRRAIEMAMRSMLRLQEVVWMKWEYVNFEKELIKIPAEIMKVKRKPHFVPITKDIMRILQDQKSDSIYVFPESSRESIAKHTLTATLNNLDVDTTTHGFRTLASTFLNEARSSNSSIERLVDDSLIEKSLAHEDKNKSKAHYDLAKLVGPRKLLLEKWSEIIDRCSCEEENQKVLDEFGIVIAH